MILTQERIDHVLSGRGRVERFKVHAIPKDSVDLGWHGAAVRWWWGPFIFSVWSTGLIDGHVHEEGSACCWMRYDVNAGDWGTKRR